VEKAKYRDDSDKTKVEDEIERYDYITNKIEDLNRELDQLSNAKDDAWGPNKIQAMDKEIAKLKQVRAATKQYADEIK
jgi:prefoldin subunit 5